MKYAKKLRKGDKVAIVSLSSGMLGEAFCSHNIEIGVKRLREYGLETSFMPNSLKGIEYLKANPKARAKDLKDALDLLNINGRIAVITFHSLEDKICKYTFNEVSKLKDVPKGLPVIPEGMQPKFKLINKKPIIATEEELNENHRSHSAKLRVIERVRV